MKYVWLIPSILIAMALFACSKSPLEKEATAIINQKCTKCHSTKRIYKQENRDRAWWDKTLARMEGYGASLSEEERKTILEYLAGR